MTSKPRLRDDVIIDLRHVSQHYGENCALDDITLQIPARQMVGLIGPDGVGKSSLISLIAGSREIQHGQVVVLGGEMSDKAHRRAVCPRIAYMPQGLGKNLYHTLSVFENVDFLVAYLVNQNWNENIELMTCSKVPG